MRSADEPWDRRDAERAFGRYRSIAGDFAAFTEALHTPLPRVVWAHPERIDRAALAQLFAEAQIASTELAWDESAPTTRISHLQRSFRASARAGRRRRSGRQGASPAASAPA